MTVPVEGGGRHVLVVDDDEATREAVSLVLRAEGLSVTAAANGADALERLRGGLRPDLILLDLMMPVLDGWMFREEQLRDPQLAKIPVVVCSAAHDLQRRASGMGAAALLSKPIDFQGLVRSVAGLATGSRTGVLVVDDEPHVRGVLELALSREGIEVWTAPTGSEALETYSRNRDQIGVVMLDVQMPGLDGPWTLAGLKKINPQVRAVFISGGCGDYDAELLLAMGAQGLLQKPFDLAEVLRTVNRLLGR